MKRVLLLIPLIAACDTGARKDLPDENQNLVETNVSVYLFPDQFPNVAHRCDGTTGQWTTTDRNVWIVYNDPACGGSGHILVFDNVSGANATEGGGE